MISEEATLLGWSLRNSRAHIWVEGKVSVYYCARDWPRLARASRAISTEAVSRSRGCKESADRRPPKPWRCLKNQLKKISVERKKFSSLIAFDKTLKIGGFIQVLKSCVVMCRAVP